MEFCPKCGMRLIRTRRTANKQASPELTCPKCGYSKQVESEELASQKIVDRSAQEPIAVIGEEEAKIRTMPSVKVECSKCGNTEAYWWIVQTRGADESPTQFFRCTKCNYTWREMA